MLPATLVFGILAYYVCVTNIASILDPLEPTQPSLTERTIQAVRTAIRTGALAPGELYSVYQLAQDLGVSRSPVREALLRLEETGMVRFERNRGFRVLLPGPRELAEIFAVRLSLECPAARMAALKATDDQLAAVDVEREAMAAAAQTDDEPEFMLHDQRLHALILDCAGNTYARKIIDNIRDAIRLVGASTIENHRSLMAVYEEHLPIIDALKRRDPDAAARAMERHVRSTGALLLRKSIEASNSSIDENELWAELLGDSSPATP